MNREYAGESVIKTTPYSAGDSNAYNEVYSEYPNVDMNNLLLWCQPGSQYYNPTELLPDYQSVSAASLLPPIAQQTNAYHPTYPTNRMPAARNGFGAQKRKTGGRRPKEEEVNFSLLAPEDRDKKLKRRERNKEAAARCRQRRLDLMEQLQDQVDELKKKNEDKTRMIEELRKEKERMEGIMANHGHCKMGNHQFVMPPPHEQQTQSRQPQPAAIRMTRSSSSNVQPKSETMDVDPTLSQVAGSDVEGRAMHDLHRPSTLQFPSTQHGHGIAISTPSSGFTPLMTSASFGQTPLGMSTGLTPTNTMGGFQQVVVSSHGNTLDTPVCGQVGRKLEDL